MTQEINEAQRVRLPMVCVCRTKVEGTKDQYVETNRIEADAVRARAHQVLTWNEEYPCTDANFLSHAYSFLDEYGADVSFAVDQWFGAYAEVKRHVGCIHPEGMEHTREQRAEHWVPELHVGVECDRLEDGLAALVLWFKENRPDPDES